MKRVLAIFMMMYASVFVYAEDVLTFEEADEAYYEAQIAMAFSNDPDFFDEEEDDVDQCECGEDQECVCGRCIFNFDEENEFPEMEEEDEEEDSLNFSAFNKTNFVRWSKYKHNFGMEKVYLKFPNTPIETKTNEHLLVCAYDNGIQYTFSA